MRKLVLLSGVALIGSSIAMTAPAIAHHSFAQFDPSKHVLVEGRVTAWNYNNPHSWLIIKALDKNGQPQTWSFEGAAPVHATRQGVTGHTFAKGEAVRVVMLPIRDGRNAGAMCFVVKEDGSFARPNDGVCNSDQVIERWKSHDWLAKGNHLDVHPAEDK